MNKSRFLGVCFAVLASAAPLAHAGEPWKEGVPQDKQDAAQRLFIEGNQLYAQQAYPAAAEKYREALKIWDHPAIHLNYANSLVLLDKPLEAAEELERALKFGSAPFKPEPYDNALLLQSSLKGQVGWLELTCDQAGAKVMLDGQPVLACPGTHKVRLLAKEHAINAELKDHLSVSRRVLVPGGDSRVEKIKLVPLDQAVVLKYKYARWAPWTAAGIGGGIAIAGLVTYLSGRGDMNEFDQEFGAKFPRGATEAELKQDSLLYDLREGAKFKGTVGISMMAVGGTALVGGAFFALVINRPYRELPVSVAPTAGGAAATFSARF